MRERVPGFLDRPLLVIRPLDSVAHLIARMSKVSKSRVRTFMTSTPPTLESKGIATNNLRELIPALSRLSLLNIPVLDNICERCHHNTCNKITTRMAITNIPIIVPTLISTPCVRER